MNLSRWLTEALDYGPTWGFLVLAVVVAIFAHGAGRDQESVEGAGAAVDGARTREATRPDSPWTDADLENVGGAFDLVCRNGHGQETLDEAVEREREAYERAYRRTLQGQMDEVRQAARGLAAAVLAAFRRRPR